jgi:hypothetical protein
MFHGNMKPDRIEGWAGWQPLPEAIPVRWAVFRMSWAKARGESA